jgi:hypothetical protein
VLVLSGAAAFGLEGSAISSSNGSLLATKRQHHASGSVLCAANMRRPGAANQAAIATAIKATTTASPYQQLCRGRTTLTATSPTAAGSSSIRPSPHRRP